METNKDIEQLLPSIQKAFDVLVEKSTDLPISTIRDDTRSPAHYAGGRCADNLEEYTAVLGNIVSLDSVAGTYCGVLPPNVETTLTLNADGTYLLIRTFKEKQNEQERLKGSFQVLDGNILMLVHPASGDNIFYKVMEDNSIIFIDSFGNEPKKENRENYALIKK